MMSGSNTQGKSRICAADGLAIAEAAATLRGGGIVAIPTETVYGLAADASNPRAVAEIYRTKGRPDFNPLIVHVADREAAQRIARFDGLADKLADAFWPGPLTLVLPLLDGAAIAKAVTAGLPTIALRMPAHVVMRSVLMASGLNLAAPSANRSGGISPTRAEHVAASLGEAAPMILDGGLCRAGIESTIVAVRDNGWQLLRPGPITAEAITKVAGSAMIGAAADKIEAPGQMASHYAPSKPVRRNAEAPRDGEWMIGFGPVTGDDTLSAGSDLAEAAARLFDALHRADASPKAAIAIAAIPMEGVGIAINDRLARAAVR